MFVFLLLSTDVMSSSSESQERCPKPDGWNIIISSREWMHDVLTAVYEFFFFVGGILHKDDLSSKQASKQASLQRKSRMEKEKPHSATYLLPLPFCPRRFEHNSRRGKESTRIVGVGVSQPSEAFLSTGVHCAFLGGKVAQKSPEAHAPNSLETTCTKHVGNDRLV